MRILNRYHALALILITLGILLFGYSVLIGESGVAWLLFIPIFYGTGLVAFIGILCITIAIFIGMFGAFKHSTDLGDLELCDTDRMFGRKVDRKVEGGAVILIGPIPIIIGSNVNITKSLVGLTIILMIIMILAFIFVI